MSLLINMWAFIISWNKWNCNVHLRICAADFTFHRVLDNCVIFIVVFWDSRSYPTVSGEADQEGSWGYRPPLIQNNVSEASLSLASVWHWTHPALTMSCFYAYMWPSLAAPSISGWEGTNSIYYWKLKGQRSPAGLQCQRMDHLYRAVFVFWLPSQKPPFLKILESQNRRTVDHGAAVPALDGVFRLISPWQVNRQEYWSGLPFPSPGDLPDQGSNPGLLHCRQILSHLSHQGSPKYNKMYSLFGCCCFGFSVLWSCT